MRTKKHGQGILGLVLIGQMIILTYDMYSISYQMDYRTTTAVIWAVLAAFIMIPYTATKVRSGAIMAKGIEDGGGDGIEMTIGSDGNRSVHHKASGVALTIEGDGGTDDREFEPSYVDDTDDFEYELPEDPTQPLRELYAKNKISMPEFERRMERVLERLDQRSANDNDEFSFPEPELEDLLEDGD